MNLPGAEGQVVVLKWEEEPEPGPSSVCVMQPRRSKRGDGGAEALKSKRCVDPGESVQADRQTCCWVIMEEQGALCGQSRPEGGKCQPCIGMGVIGILRGVDAIKSSCRQDV